MANHATTRTTQRYDHRREELSVDGGEDQSVIDRGGDANAGTISARLLVAARNDVRPDAQSRVVSDAN